jgi:endonuclease/exonuclease/phosphatase family metal-dependent hydrolase
VYVGPLDSEYPKEVQTLQTDERSTTQESGDEVAEQPTTGRRLRLLTYNVQAGITTTSYRHYVTHSWKHVLPHPQRLENLDRIAKLIQQYDVVGLQEVDAGSLRCDFVNLTEYLAHSAGFPYWYDRTNRRLGMIAQHSIGFLTRVPTSDISEHRLPGAIPGRGALLVKVGTGPDALAVVILHLALSRRARLRQLGFLQELVSDYRHVVLMGDFNCRSDSTEMRWFEKRAGVAEPIHGLFTYPSWRPDRNIDHILVSPSLQVDSVKVLNYPLSDHLPIAMEVTLPEGVRPLGSAAAMSGGVGV